MSKSKKNVSKNTNTTNEDFDVVEYEEVVLSDIEDDEPTPQPSSSSTEPTATGKSKSEKDILSYSDSCTSIDIQKLSDKPLKKIVRKPARPIRLFSFTDHDIIDKFSLADPAKKDLTMQLLDVVKSVNLRRKLKVDKDGTVVPNFYLIANSTALADSSRKIISMKSVAIVSLIREIVHMIKTCVYREVEDIEIICDSPAIFLIKYVSVKNWDSSMNSVYVVTSEYLLPYLCKIRAAEEQEKQAKLIAVNIIKGDDKKRGKQTSSSTQPIKKIRLDHQVKEKPYHYIAMKDPLSNLSNVPCAISDEEVVDTILSKYLEPEAVDFFLSQMKTAGKYSNRFRWSERDKFFALSLLRKNPTEYSILYEHYSLPSDKTIDKFMKELQNERIDDITIEDA